MNMKTFKQIIDDLGLSCVDVSKKGIPYQTARKHYLGTRPITAKYALIYEQSLGIPRHELCPHFWSETTESISFSQPQPLQN